MTKKDFIKFAAVLKELRKTKSTYDGEGNAVVRVRDVEDALVGIFVADNDRFDVARFLKACGR